MTVKQLIEALSKMDQDLVVYVASYDDAVPMSQVGEVIEDAVTGSCNTKKVCLLD